MSNQLRDVYIATSTRRDGNMSFRFGDPEAVLENRQRFFTTQQRAYTQAVIMRSRHDDIVAVVAGITPGTLAQSETESIDADALITQQSDLILGLTTADCIPLTLFDPISKTVALVHVSRHTLSRDLVNKTLRVLTEKIAVVPENLKAYLGPHIKKESYCFTLPLAEEHPMLAPYIEKRGDMAYVDVTACTVDTLTAAGVPSADITISDVDTLTDPHYFSHVQAVQTGEPEGRFLTLASLSVSP